MSQKFHADEIETSLSGIDDVMPLYPPEPRPEDDMVDYFDRELREIERQLEVDYIRPKRHRTVRFKSGRSHWMAA